MMLCAVRKAKSEEGNLAIEGVEAVEKKKCWDYLTLMDELWLVARWRMSNDGLLGKRDWVWSGLSYTRVVEA
jgi:hypothetical protein